MLTKQKLLITIFFYLLPYLFIHVQLLLTDHLIHLYRSHSYSYWQQILSKLATWIEFRTLQNTLKLTSFKIMTFFPFVLFSNHWCKCIYFKKIFDYQNNVIRLTIFWSELFMVTLNATLTSKWSSFWKPLFVLNYLFFSFLYFHSFFILLEILATSGAINLCGHWWELFKKQLK